MVNDLILDDFLRMALKEDIGLGDVTTDSLIGPGQISHCRLVAKEAGVLAGLPVFVQVFRLLDAGVSVKFYRSEGDSIQSGEVIAELDGNTRALLQGERVALNILQRMCGIATKTHRLCALIQGYPTRLADTRKTLPGFRMLDKYAVTVGGGTNHRMNLSDLVLIKDNHIAAVGSIRQAVALARKRAPFSAKIEVEAENLEQLAEAAEAGADIVMLDNMDCAEMKKAVNWVQGRFCLEASGNIDEENVIAVAATGIDLISCGALTHSVRALDISLKFDLPR
ncbi:nicotinate-nucleotide diphosphorylase (carboxylating) [Clostridium sp. W14A]|nr:nicotinate-nucleotide diphosphorylase (carboxylating) [Clostridium sp. W14A]